MSNIYKRFWTVHIISTYYGKYTHTLAAIIISSSSSPSAASLNIYYRKNKYNLVNLLFS